MSVTGGVPEASVLATDLKTSAVNAALANGMFGHADETDDFEPVTKAHPGCSVVPAARHGGARRQLREELCGQRSLATTFAAVPPGSGADWCAVATAARKGPVPRWAVRRRQRLLPS